MSNSKAGGHELLNRTEKCTNASAKTFLFQDVVCLPVNGRVEGLLWLFPLNCYLHIKDTHLHRNRTMRSFDSIFMRIYSPMKSTQRGFVRPRGCVVCSPSVCAVCVCLLDHIITKAFKSVDDQFKVRGGR